MARSCLWVGSAASVALVAVVASLLFSTQLENGVLFDERTGEDVAKELNSPNGLSSVRRNPTVPTPPCLTTTHNSSA